MRLNRRRQPDLFEEPPIRSSIPSHRRQATVEILRALLTEALSSASSIQIRKEARHEPRGSIGSSTISGLRSEGAPTRASLVD